MKKADLIKTIAQKAGINQKQAQAALEETLEQIKTTLVEKKEKVTFTGFGTFSVAKRSARTGINPSTKEKIDIPATMVPKFKPSKEGWF